MVVEILKAILVGIIASFPIGPVAILVMQKTATKGRIAGYATGMGSALTDTFFALIGIFAVGLVRDFFMVNEALIMKIGGLVIIVIGLLMTFSKLENARRINSNKRSTLAGYFLQAAGSALANPGALALSLSLVAVLHLDAASCKSPAWLLVSFVAVGAVGYWFLFVKVIDRFSSKLNFGTITKINKVVGAVVVVFGIILVTKGFYLNR